MVLQMTRAEYQTKYGVAPSVPTQAPVKMTHDEYMAKYGGVTPPATSGGTLSSVGSHLAGVAKGLGSTVLSLGKAALQGAAGLAQPGFLGVSGVNAPAPEQLPGIGGVVQSLDNAVKPTPSQEVGFNTEQFAELLLPVLGVGAKAVTKAPALAAKLEKASLRLTPAMKRDLGAKLNGVVDFLLKNKVTGSPTERTSQVDSIYQNMETQLQKFLDTNNTAKGIAASRSEILKDLDSLKSTFKNSRDYQAATRQIDEAKALFEKGGTFIREMIPIARLNELKRSTFNGAYNKAGTKVLDDVEKAIGSLFKRHIEKATNGLSIGTKSIAEFNHEYGTTITARDLLKAAESRDEVGILGKIISTVIGGGVGNVVGGPVGAGLGVLAGNQVAPIVAGTAVRSGAAQIANSFRTVAPHAAKLLAPALGVTEVEIIKHLQKLLPRNNNGDNTQPKKDHTQ